MNQKELDAIKERCDSLSKRESLSRQEGFEEFCGSEKSISALKTSLLKEDCWPEFAELASRAARDISALLAEVERLQQAQRWMPVSERLPEQHTHVLVCGTEAIGNIKYLCAVKCLDGDVFRPLSAPSVCWTHWIPLPEPPKEEQNG